VHTEYVTVRLLGSYKHEERVIITNSVNLTRVDTCQKFLNLGFSASTVLQQSTSGLNITMPRVH